MIAPLKVANTLIQKDWLENQDKSTYSTYLLNAFYLMEI